MHGAKLQNSVAKTYSRKNHYKAVDVSDKKSYLLLQLIARSHMTIGMMTGLQTGCHTDRHV